MGSDALQVIPCKARVGVSPGYLISNPTFLQLPLSQVWNPVYNLTLFISALVLENARLP